MYTKIENLQHNKIQGSSRFAHSRDIEAPAWPIQLLDRIARDPFFECFDHWSPNVAYRLSTILEHRFSNLIGNCLAITQLLSGISLTPSFPLSKKKSTNPKSLVQRDIPSQYTVKTLQSKSPISSVHSCVAITEIAEASRMREWLATFSHEFEHLRGRRK